VAETRNHSADYTPDRSAPRHWVVRIYPAGQRSARPCWVFSDPHSQDGDASPRETSVWEAMSYQVSLRTKTIVGYSHRRMTSFGLRVAVLLVAAASLSVAGCRRHDPEAQRVASGPVPAQPTPSSASQPPASAHTTSNLLDGGRWLGLADAEPPPASSSAPRTIHFAWRPPGSNPRLYMATEPEDQHRLVLPEGVTRRGRYRVVIAFHGQPKRGQAPRHYAFVRTVMETTLPLIERGEVEPLVLAIPVFRFEGQNWPDFDLTRFAEEIERQLQADEISISGFLLFGHSAAAGCGGRGLNEAARIHPVAVGFFDTCVGPGFGQAVGALRRDHVPTLLMHSVETAGFRPRQPMEYMPGFDFGKVYRPLGLAPTECPKDLPEAPLRPLGFRCAADPEGTTRALVVDTGQGQEAHDALIPVAVRYFLRQYAGRTAAH
jgi:hypothetical protein